MKANSIWRLRIISAGFILVALIFFGRLYEIQILKAQSFKDLADRQYVKPGQSIYDRGSIFLKDKDGALVSAAILKTGFRLAINPKILDDVDGAYEKINSIWPVDKEGFYKAASKKDDPYEEISNQLSLEAGEAISALEIEGVIIEKERWRFYPGGPLASHVLGFVGFSSEDGKLKGRYGLERYYEDTLSRNEGGVYTNFFTEIFSSLKDSLQSKKFISEGDLVLTLEPTVQLEIEKEIANVKEKYSADEVGAIVMNPQNGEIIAMSALPDFDPNTFFETGDTSIFTNPLVEKVYEMGSIIKPLTMLSGIDSGVITSKTTYEDKGYIVLNNARIENFDGKGRGVVDMQRVLSDSLNTGVAFVALSMGRDKFSKYMKAYDIGEETGVDLPNEIQGLISNLDSKRDIEQATASFGQGIASTPISTIRALSVLANGGYLVTPKIVSSIKYKMGPEKTVSSDNKIALVKPESTEEVTRMLVSVVDETLGGGVVKMKNHSIAAKTGTAQIAMENGRGYYEDRYLHSFFGYFPAYQPRFIVFLYAVDPKGVKYSSETWSKPFSRISRFLISYYNVPPDR